MSKKGDGMTKVVREGPNDQGRDVEIVASRPLIDARREWIASPLLISARPRGLKSWLPTSGASPANRRTQMSRTSIAALTLVVASLMGAGALATASESTVRSGADPVANLAVMAQLEKWRLTYRCMSARRRSAGSFSVCLKVRNP